MSSAMHQRLARRIAWLRYFSELRENGALTTCRRSTGIENTPRVTIDILSLEHDGLLMRSRARTGWFRPASVGTAFEATATGLAVLHETVAKHGTNFGPVSLINTPHAERKRARLLGLLRLLRRDASTLGRA